MMHIGAVLFVWRKVQMTCHSNDGDWSDIYIPALMKILSHKDGFYENQDVEEGSC